MAGISQIIRWRQGRAVISHRSVQQKARSGDAAASSSSSAASAPQPSSKVTLTGSTQATAATYLDKLKRKAKTGLQTATRVNAVNRETRSTSGPVPAADAGTPTMQQSLRDALSQYAALAEPPSVPETPVRETSSTTPAPASDSPGVAVSWDVEATFEWDAQMQDAQHARKDEAETADANEAPPTPAAG
jgi:hypothetical protein